MNVIVENFQPIAKAELELDGLTVIVGPSDRGKSALLRAIEGALFNKSGDGFVRRGASQSTVTLTGLDIVLGYEWQTRWEKGKGVNKFTISGQVYDKVGRDAPAPLQAMGFKDVQIGARVKDDKTEGGEWIRPQVSNQLLPVFLIDRPGNFLYEVLAKLSRLAVLQKAARLCTNDVRAAQSRKQALDQQMVQLTEEIEGLQPIEDQRERVAALTDRLAQWQKASRVKTELGVLLTMRKVAMVQASRTIPAAASRTLPNVTVSLKLRSLVEDRAVAARAAAGKLPVRKPASPEFLNALSLYQKLQPLVADRTVEASRVKQLDKVEYQKALDHTDAVSQLERLKLELKVCPVCGSPL